MLSLYASYLLSAAETVPYGHTMPDEPSLTDLFHEVPHLWDFMDGKCYKGLLGTCVHLRHEVKQIISKIRFPLGWQSADLTSLVKHSWAQLQYLDLSTSLMTGAAAAQLTSASWPLLRSLTISHAYMGWPMAKIFNQFENKWPSLREFTCFSGVLDAPAVEALNKIDWPMLTCLRIVLCSQAVPALMQGRWRHLKQLSLGIGLNGNNMQHLSGCPWHCLEELQLHSCTFTAVGVLCLTQAHLPGLKRLSLVDIRLFGGASSLVPLSRGSWPELTELIIDLARDDDIFVHELVLGAWPCLNTLTLENIYFPSRFVSDLIRAPWPALTSLTLGGHHWDPAAVTASCTGRWPALQLLTIGHREMERQTLTFLNRTRSQCCEV